jgi:hypothetical protein
MMTTQVLVLVQVLVLLGIILSLPFLLLPKTSVESPRPPLFSRFQPHSYHPFFADCCLPDAV